MEELCGVSRWGRGRGGGRLAGLSRAEAHSFWGPDPGDQTVG